MAPSLKRLPIQSEVEAHFLPEHHRGKMCFWSQRRPLKTLRKYLLKHMTLQRNSTESTYIDT